MSNPTAARSTSPLDNPPVRFSHRPFYAETLSLLRGVRDHDFESLQWLCDDDFGIVDVDPAGRARVIRNKSEWSQWFHELFSTLDALGAATDSEIISYEAIRQESLGYSVVEFRQSLTVAEHTATFECIATIIWKNTKRGWREARWHGSVISSEIPDELRELSESEV
jgi:SnoaL-like domain